MAAKHNSGNTQSNNTTLPMNIHPLPPVGSIVWAYFPLVGNETVPGPKDRPALVTGHVPNRHAIEVAYGTSSPKVNTVYPGEFVVQKEHTSDFRQTKLSRTTKFDMGKTKILPFNTHWFTTAPVQPGQPHPTSPSLGSLPISYHPAATAAAQAVRLRKQQAKGKAS